MHRRTGDAVARAADEEPGRAEGGLSDPAFPEFAKTVVLFLHNTSHVDDEPYPTLLREKGFTGFPSLCFMDAEGRVLAKQGRKRFEELLGQARAGG
jgi:hypothetical protein